MNKGLAARVWLAATLSLFLCACGREEYRSFGGIIWNTAYKVTYAGPVVLEDSVRLVLGRVDASLNYFNPESLLSRVNSSDSCRVDSDFIKVYECARRVHEASGGAFDPTLAPVIDAWGFGKGHEVAPDTAAVERLRPFTGLERTSLKDGLLAKESREVTMNFSAVAKGYACDAVADMFRRNGVADYLIEIGGEIRASGSNPAGTPWNIAIDLPKEGSREGYQQLLSATDCGIATSGNYRNFHETPEGEKFGHTIDPQTLRPARTDVLSATVICPTAAEADAYATACMTLGSSAAKKMILDRRLAAYLILASDSVWSSPSMTQYLKK